MNQVVMDHLEFFAYQNQGNLDTWKPLFKHWMGKHDVERIEDKVRIYQTTTGLKGLKLNNPITPEEFKRVCDEVEIQFTPNNQEKFKINEKVELWVEVKNIQTIHYKVFEFNTLTYYRKTMKPFNTSVDLDGLESAIEGKRDIDAPENCKRKINFEFPQLTGKVGLFIVEFVGNGKSARAVIKKGSLSLIHRSTIAGHQATMLDDDRKVCKGKGTGLWIENKFYAAKEDGSIFIPYATHGKQLSLIMVHDTFAQLCEFYRKEENYEFSCSFNLNKEQVLVGSTATVLLTPSLKINGRRCNLDILQNVDVKVKTQDFIDNTPTTKNFNNLKV